MVVMLLKYPVLDMDMKSLGISPDHFTRSTIWSVQMVSYDSCGMLFNVKSDYLKMDNNHLNAQKAFVSCNKLCEVKCKICYKGTGILHCFKKNSEIPTTILSFNSIDHNRPLLRWISEFIPGCVLMIELPKIKIVYIWVIKLKNKNNKCLGH